MIDHNFTAQAVRVGPSIIGRGEEESSSEEEQNLAPYVTAAAVGAAAAGGVAAVVVLVVLFLAGPLKHPAPAPQEKETPGRCEVVNLGPFLPY